MAPRIGVFPASSGLGTSVVNHLTKLISPSQLILIARNPVKWSQLGAVAATRRPADHDDPARPQDAFEGVDVLMLILHSSFDKARVDGYRTAIQAALSNGVTHVFYSSLGFAGNLTDHSVAHVMRAHPQATDGGVSRLPHRYSPHTPTGSFTHTSIREGLYTESFPIYTAWLNPAHPPATNESTIPHPSTGLGVCWVKPDELGEATAKLIVNYTTDPEQFPHVNDKVLLISPRDKLHPWVDIQFHQTTRNVHI